MILRILTVVLATTGLLAPGARAVLKQYHFNTITIVASSNASPDPTVIQYGLETDRTYAAIDDDGGGNPRLKKLKVVIDTTTTVEVPALGGRIFISYNTESGPTGEFTGTGSTDTTIAWGLLTGWTITGTHWCHSSPAFICLFSHDQEQESFRPDIVSAFYDYGTWTFHGTGFVGTPTINLTHDNDPGNDQSWPRGFLVQDGRIPALPLFAVACLSGSILAAGLAALRRRHD